MYDNQFNVNAGNQIEPESICPCKNNGCTTACLATNAGCMRSCIDGNCTLMCIGPVIG